MRNERLAENQSHHPGHDSANRSPKESHRSRMIGTHGLTETEPMGSAAEHVSAADAQGRTQDRLNPEGGLTEGKTRRSHMGHRHRLECRSGQVPSNRTPERRFTRTIRQTRIAIQVDDMVTPGRQRISSHRRQHGRDPVMGVHGTGTLGQVFMPKDHQEPLLPGFNADRMLPIDHRQRRSAQGHEPTHATEVGNQSHQSQAPDPRSA